MLARIAHELFWLGRYVARAEHTARMLDGIYQADLQGPPDDPAGVVLSWGGLLAIMGAKSDPAESRPGAPRDHALSVLLLDREQPAAVASCVARARDGARTVRDVISADMWEAINSFHLALAGGRDGVMVDRTAYSVTSLVKARCALFWGLAQRTMLRDETYAFLEAGGRLESADMVLRMLRVALPPGEQAATDPAAPARDGHALALLQAVGALQAYRRAVTAPPTATPVARFLLFTRSYPDSVAASVDRARAALSVSDANPRASEPVLRLSRLAADLDFRGGSASQDGELLEVCEIVGRELVSTDRDISERYFGGRTREGHFVRH